MTLGQFGVSDSPYCVTVTVFLMFLAKSVTQVFSEMENRKVFLLVGFSEGHHISTWEEFQCSKFLETR